MQIMGRSKVTAGSNFQRRTTDSAQKNKNANKRLEAEYNLAVTHEISSRQIRLYGTQLTCEQCYLINKIDAEILELERKLQFKKLKTEAQQKIEHLTIKAKTMLLHDRVLTADEEIAARRYKIVLTTDELEQKKRSKVNETAQWFKKEYPDIHLSDNKLRCGFWQVICYFRNIIASYEGYESDEARKEVKQSQELLDRAIENLRQSSLNSDTREVNSGKRRGPIPSSSVKRISSEESNSVCDHQGACNCVALDTSQTEESPATEVEYNDIMGLEDTFLHTIFTNI